MSYVVLQNGHILSSFETIEEAATFLHKRLGGFSPGWEYFETSPIKTFHLYDFLFEIVER